MELDGNTVA
jgi:dynein heavy chain, axonemal